MNLGLDGRVALVAGASAGLGKASALALAREGARVGVASRSIVRAKAAAAEISGKTRSEAVPFAADVEDAQQCKRWVDAALKHWGRLDVLVCNAGGPPEGAALEATDAEWREGFERNLLSFARLSRLAAPAMKKGKFGRIVMIGSTSAKQPIDNLAISNVLRTGMLSLVKTLSDELGPFGVTVNSVLPGYTTTERLDDLAKTVAAKRGQSVKQVHEAWAASVPLRRLAEPMEIGAAVAFLASESASYITGVALSVDGGRTRSPF
jgi:3-oxoacyl-[acyl-carrier protein] reductase